LSGAGGILLIRQAMQPVEQGFQRLKQFTDASMTAARMPSQ